MPNVPTLLLGGAALVLLALASPVVCAEDPRPGAKAVLERFATAWPAARTDHRRPSDDSWKAYGAALKDLVAGADRKAIRAGLAHENRQVRALCARVLGFLRAEGAVPDLARALAGDAWPTVRLLAADSLGAIRTAAAVEALERARDDETARDVRLHVKRALEREGAVGDAPRQAVLTLDEATFASASVGAAAPDVALEDADGEVVRLSKLSGEERVVLVFLYGDG